MASGFGESTSRAPHNSSFTSNNGNGDAGNFECNICFDLAQDPIVTLCGHLFCWPCLYKWLHFHSKSRECPVCKALVEEEKLVPLYGRGKTSTDPRSKSIPGVNIPNRPAGQRPETAPPPEPNHFGQHGFGFMGGLGGFAPMATARLGNFTFSAAFGGLIPSLFNLQVHGFPDAAMYGPAKLSDYGLSIVSEAAGNCGENGEGPKSWQMERLEDDVCSFGFILLESLVGPSVSARRDKFLLDELASCSSQEGRQKLLNPIVLATCSQESLSIVVTITNKCICSESWSRPSFEDILWNLQYAVQVQGTADGEHHR